MTAATAHGFRDSAWGKAAILGVVLLAAFLVAKSCGATETRVSQDQAVQIARAEIDFTPARVQVRLLKRGLQSREYWLVGLLGAGVSPHTVSVVIDARSGEVTEVRRTR